MSDNHAQRLKSEYGYVMLSKEELETLRRRLINALTAVEAALGCEPSVTTRAERRGR